jgi:hypothetical protein
VGPGPDRRVASQPTAARSVRAGEGAPGCWPAGPDWQWEREGGEKRVGTWADPLKETEWAEPG